MSQPIRETLKTYAERGDKTALPILALDELGAEVVIGWRARIECIRMPEVER